MRLIVLLLLLFSVSPAFAIIAPGPPPWYCRPDTACNANDICVSFYGPPMGFNLRKVEYDENKFIMEGLHGDQRFAAIFPSLEDARLSVLTDRSDNRATIILIPNERVADARGFDVHYTGSRGFGERFVSEDKLLIICGGLPTR